MVDWIFSYFIDTKLCGLLCCDAV